MNTQSETGQKRLRRVALVCQDYGQRVQYSVFECTLSETKLERFRQRLLKEIDPERDSLRLYYLGSDRDAVVESHGRDRYVDFTGPIIL